MTNLDDILAKLSPKTTDKYRLARDISKELVPTASIGINRALGGGIGIGKQTTIWGNESSGKSAVALQTIALNQKLGHVCAYIDAEKTFDRDWANRLGVNTDELIVSQVSSIGEMTDVTIDMVRAGVYLLVVDSTSALMPKSFYGDDGHFKPFEDTGQIGQFARELGQSSRMIQGENFSCAILHISQVRMDLGGFRPSMKQSGGKELGHLDSLRIKMISSKSDTAAIKGKLHHGETILEEQIGRKVNWYIEKNKLNGHYTDGEYNLYFRGDFVGVDNAGELLDYGIKYGVVQQGGSWLTVYGERFQGRPKAIQHVRDNPDIAAKLEGDLNGKSL